MLKKIIIINFITLFLSSISFSEIVNKINISGNKRISKESIIVFGKIKINSDYSSNDLNRVIKDLYETNFFKDINIFLDKGLLTLNIIENPIIEDLEINGVKNSKLKEFLLERINLKSRNSFIESILETDKNIVNNTLRQSGYYFSEVKTSTLTNEEQNSVRLIYDIELGKKAKINKIIFTGDKKVKDKKLKNIITSEESQFWKFISNNIYLNENKINLDLRLLENYYRNNGYYNVNVTNSFAEFKDNNSFNLIFNIDAGEIIYFNNLKLELPTDYEPSKFTKIDKLLFKLKDKVYSINKLNKILNEVDKIAISKQYDFVNATLNEKILPNNKLDIIITLEDSEKFYVEKINIYGNQFTLEETIRNNLIVDEGDPYNEILFNKSINTLKSKNFFTAVTSEILPGSSKDFKVVNINVEEKPTGEISLGAGVGSSGGNFGGGIKENNFLGKGIKVDTNFVISANSVKGSFIYARPNFNYTDNTLFTSLSNTSTDNLKEFGYKTNQSTFSLGTKFEQYENLNFSPEIAGTYENLETTSDATSILKKQTGDYWDMYLNYALDYDQRDQRYQTKSGFRSLFYQEVPIHSKYSEIINSYEFTKYHSLFSSNMIGKLNFHGKAVNSFTNENVRVSKRLYIPYSKLRGFEFGKIGPIENGDYVGGNYSSSLNLSTTLPQVLPSFQNIDFSYFIDIGNVWGVDYDQVLDKKSSIRSSTGISMDVLTPVGPMNFSLTKPIKKKSTDKTESFRFNLGTTF